MGAYLYSCLLFAIWDSFRSAVDLNNQYVLAARENGALKPFKLDAVEINYLDKNVPLPPLSGPWSHRDWGS